MSDDPINAGTQVKQRQARRVVGLLALVVSVVVGLLAWVVRPPAIPAPSPGEILAGDVLVTWSEATRIRAFGLESLHPFDIGKMDRMAAHLVDQGLLGWSDFAVGTEPDRAALEQVHTPSYLDSLTDPAVLSTAIEFKLPGFLGAETLDARVLRPFRLGVGGTVVAARHAASGGLGINLAGGYHHAQPTLGHGFCLYNDVAVAVAMLRAEGFDGTVLIVDTDAHQGDGNHAAFATDPGVVTYSVHQGELFPYPKVPGDLDRPLLGGTGDAEFLEVLDADLRGLVEAHEPDLMVHVAGADVLSDDPLAGLALSPEGLTARDALVQGHARSAGAGLLYVLGGGYGPSAAAAQGASIAAMIRAAQESAGL
jgi:acetoin utilization deacetylase AcuC-like enzyme